MELKELISLLRNTASQGAQSALAETGCIPNRLTRSEAYRRYGRSNVDRWQREGLIEISNKSIDLVKLEAVAASSNRITYLPVADR